MCENCSKKLNSSGIITKDETVCNCMCNNYKDIENKKTYIKIVSPETKDIPIINILFTKVYTNQISICKKCNHILPNWQANKIKDLQIQYA